MRAVLHLGPRDGHEIELPVPFLAFELGDPHDASNSLERYTLSSIQGDTAHYHLTRVSCEPGFAVVMADLGLIFDIDTKKG